MEFIHLLKIQVEMSNIQLDIVVSSSEQRPRTKIAISILKAIRLSKIILKSENR